MSSKPAAQPQLRPGWGSIVGISAVLIAVVVLLFAHSMQQGLNHDEHQFLAPAILMAREGLQPYRDFVLFHLPNQVLLHAAIFRWTGNYVLAAKLLAVACGAGIAFAVFFTGLRNPVGGEWRLRWPTALAVLAFLLFDPLFCFTTGKTWNQDTSTFFAVAAFLLQLCGVERKSLVLCCLGGVLAALAVGCRLTLAPFAAALAVFPLFLPTARKARVQLIAAYAAGGVVGAAPVIWYFATAPEAFLFGNFEAPRLRLLDPSDERVHKTRTWWRKMRFFVKEVMQPSWPLFLSFLALALAPAVRWLRERGQGSARCALALWAIVFLIIGCFAPSRYQYQHLFAVIPFVVLAAIYGAAALNLQTRSGRRLAGISVALAAVTLLFGLRHYSDALAARDPKEWTAARVAEAGEEIAVSLIVHRAMNMVITLSSAIRDAERRASAPVADKVLTLAPLLPLAGGLEIYPELAIGVFAWRATNWVAPERRGRLKIIAPEDLEEFLAGDPPAAILTGVEETKNGGAAMEQPLIDYAIKHQFQPVRLKKKRTLWVPPEFPAAPAQ